MPPTEPTGESATGAPAYADLTVRVHLGHRDLAGELIIDGRPTGNFTGWLGLLAALDEAIDTLRPPGPQNGVG